MEEPYVTGRLPRTSAHFLALPKQYTIDIVLAAAREPHRTGNRRLSAPATRLFGKYQQAAGAATEDQPSCVVLLRRRAGQLTS